MNFRLAIRTPRFIGKVMLGVVWNKYRAFARRRQLQNVACRAFFFEDTRLGHWQHSSALTSGKELPREDNAFSASPALKARTCPQLREYQNPRLDIRRYRSFHPTWN
jgi:hypothetical protein